MTEREPARPRRSPGEPVLPVAPEDRDEAWGERPEDDDATARRLRDDRPPHYDRS